MQITINDQFHLRGHTIWPIRWRWQLFEWEPCDVSTPDTYKPITRRVDSATMEAYLLAHDCPQEALEAFREAAGIGQGTENG